MAITTTFDPPLPSDSPATFNTKAFTLLGDLNTWSTEANAVQTDVNAKQATASAAATTASTAASNASTSESNAAASAASAAASFDSFDDRYLGPKASNPALDNDGAALLEGALYWNTTVKEMRTYNGTAWVTTSAANAVSRSGDTMTGPLAQAAGTAALPSYTFSGDTNTGIYSPGADQLAIAVAGSDALNIAASRAISTAVATFGIGTTSSAGLDVNSNLIQVGTKDAVPGAGGSVRYRDDTNTTRWLTGFLGNAGATNFTIRQVVAGRNDVTIDSATGNVGINAATVSFKLDVNGSSGDGIRYLNTTNSIGVVLGASSALGQVGTLTNHPLVALVNGSERLRIDTSGNISIPTLGARITGDFSNATVANRLSFQTSVANANSSVGALPSGTATVASFRAYSASDPTNASVLDMAVVGGSDARITSAGLGSGSALKMSFYMATLEAMQIDTSRNVLVTGSGGLGYGVGSGGTVTQATSKTTGVTLNKPSGKITMNNAALAAGAQVEFVLTNSTVAIGDKLVVHPDDPTFGFHYAAECYTIISGAAYIKVRNNSTGSRSDALPLTFAVIKGATS